MAATFDFTTFFTQAFEGRTLFLQHGCLLFCIFKTKALRLSISSYLQIITATGTMMIIEVIQKITYSSRTATYQQREKTISILMMNKNLDKDVLGHMLKHYFACSCMHDGHNIICIYFHYSGLQYMKVNSFQVRYA